MTTAQSAFTLVKAAADALDPGLSLGPVRLVVRDRDASEVFWRDHIGLDFLHARDGVVALGAAGTALIELQHSPEAPSPGANATGLYHLAILVPSRRDLAVALHRFASVGTQLQGASDHGVSEAIYLSDPEGNGVEIYADRPRDQWGEWGRQPAIAPFDIDGVLGELAGRAISQLEERLLPAGTIIGHVHLKVADIDEATEWYRSVFGLDVTALYGRQAAFVSAGGYHHHVGLNTWHSGGGSAPPKGSTGLARVAARLAGESELARLLERVRAAGGRPQDSDRDGVVIRDPSGNAWHLTVR